MNHVLLDTHLLLWAAAGSEQLPEGVIRRLNDHNTQPLFSAASIWEIVIKSGLGPEDFKADAALLRRGLLDNGYQELPITSAHTREPLNNSARARRRLCGRLRFGLGERGLVIPNKRAQTRRRPRKGPSRMGFAGEAASRSLRHSAVAMATVTRAAPTDLRPLRPKRAPRRVI